MAKRGAPLRRACGYRASRPTPRAESHGGTGVVVNIPMSFPYIPRRLLDMSESELSEVFERLSAEFVGRLESRFP